MTVERVYFSISGDFLTSQARDFVLDNDWDRGLSFLMDSLVGITMEQCQSILDGSKKLIGINDLDMVDETEEEKEKYLKKLDFLFAGIVKDGNQYFKPYAFVDSWGEDDTRISSLKVNKYNCYLDSAVPPRLPGDNARFSKWSLARNNYYMDNPFNDKTVVVKDDDNQDVVVLWKEVRIPPTWIKVFKGTESYEKAYKSFIKTQFLSHRGAFTDKTISKKTDSVADKFDLELNEVDSVLNKFQQDQDYFEQIIEAYKKALENSNSALHDINATCGWMDVKGNIIPCKYSEHTKLAFAICEKRFNIETSTPDDFLIKNGWIKLQNKRFWLSDQNWKVKQKQFNTITDYIDFHKLESEPMLSVDDSH